MRGLAAVFAHPDDETFAIGGTLARYSDDGVRCALYCATDGDAGRSSGVPVSSKDALGRLRREELRAACGILGVSVLEHGGYPDGGLADAEPDAVVGEIVRFLRRERPQVVITFGPEGAPTRHPDHQAICRLATTAFHAAGDVAAFPAHRDEGPPPLSSTRLCYVTWPPPLPGTKPSTMGQPIDIEVDVVAWLARKIAAFDVHCTQHEHRAHFERLALADRECYFVAGGTQAARGADDLFSGLR